MTDLPDPGTTCFVEEMIEDVGHHASGGGGEGGGAHANLESRAGHGPGWNATRGKRQRRVASFRCQPRCEDRCFRYSPPLVVIRRRLEPGTDPGENVWRLPQDVVRVEVTDVVVAEDDHIPVPVTILRYFGPLAWMKTPL